MTEWRFPHVAIPMCGKLDGGCGNQLHMRANILMHVSKVSGGFDIRLPSIAGRRDDAADT